MFEKIMVATDLSKSSYALVECLDSLKEYGTKEILLAQCLSMQEVTSAALSYSTVFMDSILQEQKEILEKKGFTVDTRILSGSVDNEMNEIAEKEDYSVIVVGAESENMMKVRMFGSFAYDVIRYAQKPVLLIRLLEKKKKGEETVEAINCGVGDNILFPTDFSENAEYAFDHLKKIIAQGAKKITLVHVQDESKIVPHLSDKLEKFNEIDTKRLEDMKQVISSGGEVEVDTVIRFGSPSVEILKLVEERDIKLVVMGSQGRGFVKQLFLGSVSNNVARRSSSSVLLIPAFRK
ncbi:universal stress protein [Alkalibacterium sp. f15]|uniref:universal stress protein n=1 Tax=Alkalibacterium sp. f15 TaxID=3414029 RepID=UPI003BF80199